MLNQSSKKAKITRLTRRNIIQAKFNNINDDYIFEFKPIGSGGFGSVYLAKHIHTEETRAIKHIKLQKNLKKTNIEGNFFIFYT